MLVHHALLQRYYGVVGNGDPFRTNFRAALGDVAIADPMQILELLRAIDRVQRMHLERCRERDKSRPDEFVVLFMIAQHVADVLAEVALDAFPEFLNAVDIALSNPPRPIL